MAVFTGFEHGMGIGGWLTNYKRFNVLSPEKYSDLSIGDFEHFESYITEDDIKYIASLGMDHVRVGFDQVVLEEKPGVYRECIFKKLDDFISWCEKYSLNIVLNLHKAVGNYCDIEEEIQLMESPELQERFINLWLAVEDRYHNNNKIAFELLNEVRDIDPELWNQVADKLIAAMRQRNKDRILIIGGTCWNNPAKLKEMNFYDDENIVYTFHFYAPFEFTHQQGVLQADPLYYNRKMPYPGDIERYRDYQLFVHKKSDAYAEFDQMDINYLASELESACEFARLHPKTKLWCGEFGTIRHAKLEWRENYMRDMIYLLKKNNISYCVWNYLSTPNDGNRFSLVDDDSRKILSSRLADIIAGKVD